MRTFGAKPKLASGNTKCKQRTQVSAPVIFTNFDPGIATIRFNDKVAAKLFMQSHRKERSGCISPLSLETFGELQLQSYYARALISSTTIINLCSSINDSLRDARSAAIDQQSTYDE